MILERMTPEEMERIGNLIEPQVRQVARKTSLPKKLVYKALLVSTHFLTKESDKVPVSLAEYIRRHCQRVASDLSCNLYDAQLIFSAWVEVLVGETPMKSRDPPGSPDRHTQEKTKKKAVNQ